MGSTIEYGLGDAVWFTSTLHRVEERRLHNKVRGRFWKVWQPVDHELRHGIVVGKRTLANGWLDGGYGEPTVFVPEEHLTAWLVAYHLRRKPVLTLLDDDLTERGERE